MRVAILDDWEDAAATYLPWRELPRGVEVTVYRDHVVRQDELARRLLPFDAVMVMRERTPFPRQLFERLPNLELLVTSGAANVAIDLAAATDHGVLVCGAPGESGREGVAELTFGLMLALARHLPQGDTRVRSGAWGGRIGLGLHGRTLGLLGLGKIGEVVATRAAAFGMRVVAWSENLTEDRAREVGAELLPRDELFATSDFVSIHLRLGPRTRNLVDRDAFALMKPTSYLINTSRGPIVDNGDLVNALTSRRIAGAGLDVFDLEPLPVDHPLLRLENTVLAPHVGYVTDATLGGFFASYGEVLQAYDRGDPIHVLNPSVATAGG